jgi:hypothetical protein
MTDKFSWFAARLLFEASQSVENSHSTLFEERVVLVRSEAGVDEATRKARKLGLSSSEEYQNQDGETVTWTFKEILDLVQLDEAEIEDGSEVYHHFLKPAEVDQVRESLRPGSLG